MRALKKSVQFLLLTSLAGCGQQLVEFRETGGGSSSSAIDLGSLTSFVAVAGQGLTNSDSPDVTVLNGNVGLSPLATCLSDGVPCSTGHPQINNGALFANDAGGVAAAAKADLVSAYDEAQGKPPGTTESGLAGLVLAPGVYTSGSTMILAVNGILTLDGQNDPNASWIFQLGSALTVNAGAEVRLINEAKAANVFWAVGSSATLQENVKFKGTVLAIESISVGTDSTIEGRLLCRDGAITLLSNVITLPSP